MFLHHFRLNFIVLFVYLSLLTCWWSMVSARGHRPSNSKLCIIGGEASRPGVWPFMAAIYHKTVPLCGGVVWNDNTILTAGHCVNCLGGREDLEDFAIYLGHSDISQLDSNYLFGKLNGKWAPGYIGYYNEKDKDAALNDLALIRLDRSIDFGGRHSLVSRVGKPVPLDLLDTAKCITMGWDYTSVGWLSENVTNPLAKPSNILMELKVTVHGEKHCAHAQKRMSYTYNSSMHLCASNPRGGSPYRGDSGGPLVCPLRRDPTRYSLVCIASFGHAMAGHKVIPTYYTKVGNYLDWIEDQVAHWGPGSDDWWDSIVWESVLYRFVTVVGVAVLLYCCLCRGSAVQQR